MEEQPTPPAEHFYEVEIGGKIYRVSRSETEKLADQLSNGTSSGVKVLKEVFKEHPEVETDVPGDPDPHNAGVE